MGVTSAFKGRIMLEIVNFLSNSLHVARDLSAFETEVTIKEFKQFEEDGNSTVGTDSNT